MVEAVFHQSAFIGGEWSPRAQGRSESPLYRAALNVCLNALPVEEGAWMRRCGTQNLGPTKGRETAKLLPFASGGGDPFVMECSHLSMQFYWRKGRVCTNDVRTVVNSGISGGYLGLLLDDDHGWSVGDAIIMWPPAELAMGVTEADVGPFLNRVFKIHSDPDTDQVYLGDDLGNVFSVTSPDDSFVGWKVYRLKRFVTPWETSDLSTLRIIQARERGIILSGSRAAAPRVLTIETEGGLIDDSDPLFGGLDVIDFIDGPYLDSQETAPGVLETGAIGGTSGSVVFEPAVTLFAANDIGRLIRVWTQPADWVSGTTYAYGDTVTYNGEWWTSIAQDTFATANVGIIPGSIAYVAGQAGEVWVPSVDAGRWAWGTITAVSMDLSTADIDLVTDLNPDNGLTITEWQFGVYKSGQYPTCGCYHDGRLWLAGAVANRIDASKSNDIFNFGPSDANGFVADDNAIAADLNFDDIQLIYWLLPDPQGILVGTAGGEVLITASQLNDPLTPSSRQANKSTSILCADTPPRRVGSAVIFVQRYQRRLIEHLADGYSGKFSGRHLNEFSKHLAVNGIAEIAYQEETAPVLWARDFLGNLSGITYRRLGRFVTDDPTINAGHRHEIADGDRLVVSMCVTPTTGGLGDALYLCTCSSVGDDFAVEVMFPLIKEI